MTAHELYLKYGTSHKIRSMLADGKFIQVIKELRTNEGCGFGEAKAAVDLLRGGPVKVFTDDEVYSMIVRNAIRRLDLTEMEYEIFKRKGLID